MRQDPQPAPPSRSASGAFQPAPASISFCVTSGGPPARTRALLELVRPFVEEIVLAVDERREDETLDACADLADRRLVYEFVPPPARLIGWIHEQCSADWILRLDDDEVPSTALLDALTALRAERRLASLALPRRWLFEGPDRFLADHPWTPDYQVRLVRNVPGLWSFRGDVHTGAEVVGERRFAELPIYHLDVLLEPLERRREKARRFEELRPNHRTEDFPVNHMYIPEDETALTTLAVPPGDQDLIARVLRPQSPGRQGRTPMAPVERAGLESIERANATRIALSSTYRARLSFPRPRKRMPAASTCQVEVDLTNLGGERWSALGAGPPVFLTYRWLNAGGQDPVVAEGLRTPLPETVAPGQESRVVLAVRTPDAPGDYVLEVDLIHERVRRFGSEVRMAVSLEPRRAAHQTRSGPSSVLYVVRAFPTLSETFVLNEILTLEARGERIGIESLDLPANEPRHPEFGRLAAEVRYLDRTERLLSRPGLRTHLPHVRRRPLRWFALALRARRSGAWAAFEQSARVADRARREGFAHIHAHFVDRGAPVARDAAALSGLRFTVTAHAGDIYHAVHAPLVAERVRGAAAVITQSRYNQRHLRSLLPRASIEYQPNGVPPAARAPAPADGPVLCVARLVPKKGIDVLLEAVARLSPRMPELQVEIIGTGPLWEELNQHVADRRLEGHVHLVGALTADEVAEAYRRCSLFALPCRVDANGDRDSSPTVLAEALARGLPVVSTAVAGVPELVRDGETGLLVPVDDPVALSEAMHRLLTDRALALRMGGAGRELVQREWTAERQASALQAVLEGIGD